jgi:hypothetical protein
MAHPEPSSRLVAPQVRAPAVLVSNGKGRAKRTLGWIGVL